MCRNQAVSAAVNMGSLLGDKLVKHSDGSVGSERYSHLLSMVAKYWMGKS